MTSDHSSILQKMVSVFFVILGNVLYALTVKLFLLPADLVTGGTTGIGLAVNHYTGLSISGFVLVFNIIMLLAGFSENNLHLQRLSVRLCILSRWKYFSVFLGMLF